MRSPPWRPDRDRLVDENGEVDERRLMERRVFERRWSDRWLPRIDRGIAGLAVALLVYSVVIVQKQADKTDRVALDAKKQAETIQRTRKITSQEICQATARNNEAIRDIIVEGAKSSIVFERLFKSYGAPPYRERVRQAERNAERFPAPDCAAIARRIQEAEAK